MHAFEVYPANGEVLLYLPQSLRKGSSDMTQKERDELRQDVAHDLELL